MTRMRFSHATVVAYLALFVALGTGGAWALDKVTSKQIAKNAIHSKHIKNGAVKSPKLADGTVSTRKLADGAVTADKLAANEPFRDVGSPGQPAFENGWANYGDDDSPAGFYIDVGGTVHLRGEVITQGGNTAPQIFTLPPGYRPSQDASFPAARIGPPAELAQLSVSPNGAVGGSCATQSTCAVSLDSIAFRAEP